MPLFNELFSDIERAVRVIGALVVLSSSLIAIVFVLLVWSRFVALPLGAKVLVFLAGGVLLLIVAVLVGWVAESQVIAVYGGLTEYAVHIVRWADGLTRRYPIIPVALLVVPVFLMWPAWREENHE